jgi:nicotinamide riboside transporter PnuC
MIELFGYMATFLSCLGNVFIIYKKKIGFVIWTFGNITWIFVDYKIGLYSQIIMMVFYAILNVWGWVEWNKSKNDVKNNLTVNLLKLNKVIK